MNNTQAIVLITDMLGGMEISPAILEWANDVPVAQAIMNAVAEQLGVGSDVASPSAEVALRAAVKEIALESQELELLQGISGSSIQSTPAFSGYKLPSEIQRDIDRVHLETQCLEEEAERLNLRTQQVIAASRSMSHDLQSLHDKHAVVRTVNDDVTNRLTELSMEMEGIVADSTQACYSLLSSFEPLAFDSYTSSFQRLSEVHSSYTHSFMSCLDAAEASLAVSLTEIAFDAEELEDLLRCYGPDVKLEEMPSSVRDFYKQEAYTAHVNNLCDQVDDAGTDVIEKALHLAGDTSGDLETCIIPDARIELEAAVEMDQITYISARGSFLGHATTAMHDSILSPLDYLLSGLSLEEKLVQEAEVLCGVLKEEVKCVTSSPPSPEIQPSSEGQGIPKAAGAQGWERELEARLHPFGPGEDALCRSLDIFNAESRSILDTIYADSPLNTSPPFAYSCRFNTLLEEARKMATQLAEETGRLTKGVENSIESRRIQRKLGAFVDQFTM